MVEDGEAVGRGRMEGSLRGYACSGNMRQARTAVPAKASSRRLLPDAYRLVVPHHWQLVRSAIMQKVYVKGKPTIKAQLEERNKILHFSLQDALPVGHTLA